MPIIRRLGLATVMILFGGISPARANFVTYVFSGTGTGMLGTQSFTNDSFTITVTSDTSLITPFSFTRNNFVNNGFSISPSPTSISLANVGVASFIGGEKVFVNNSTSILGLQLPSNSDLLDLPASPPFDTYNMQTSLGPIFVASPTAVNQFQGVATSLGSISFSGITNVTFQATVVPEPSSFALCGLAGLSGLGYAWRRRKRAATA
jgi:hypothetical protein